MLSDQMEIIPMKKLSDTQLVILGAAAQRADLSVLPLPDSLKLKGGALTKVMDALRNRGLIRVIGAGGGPERVVITSEGMAAIGVEPDEDAPTGGPGGRPAPTPVDSDAPAVEAPAPATEADSAPAPAKRKATPQGKGRQGRARRQRAEGSDRRSRRPASPRRAPAPSRRS